MAQKHDVLKSLKLILIFIARDKHHIKRASGIYFAIYTSRRTLVKFSGKKLNTRETRTARINYPNFRINKYAHLEINSARIIMINGSKAGL